MEIDDLGNPSGPREFSDLVPGQCSECGARLGLGYTAEAVLCSSCASACNMTPSEVATLQRENEELREKLEGVYPLPPTEREGLRAKISFLEERLAEAEKANDEQYNATRFYPAIMEAVRAVLEAWDLPGLLPYRDKRIHLSIAKLEETFDAAHMEGR